MIGLSARHEAIVSFVPQGARVLDVGTDHGYIPIALLKRGIAQNVIASDIHEGPLLRAKHNMDEAGVSFALYHTDGLRDIPIDDVDTIIIAGMGGELIARILSEKTLENRRLILCPHSKPHVVRAFFSIVREQLVCDAGRFYTVMEARQKAPNLSDEASQYISPLLYHDPLFSEWIKSEKQKNEAVISSLQKAKETPKELSWRLWYKGELEKHDHLPTDFGTA